MKTKFLAIVILFCLQFGLGKAQFSLRNNYHHLEFSGSVSSFYNFRNLKDGLKDLSKNRFAIRDAQFQFEYRFKKQWESKFQFDLADLVTNGNDPENPGILDAWVKYNGIKNVSVWMGYGIVPYSRSNFHGFSNTPYWSRAEIAKGTFFSSRDVGVLLQSNLFNQCLNVYAGVYTGLGELSIKGVNDPSGKLECIGRIDFSFPSRYRYEDIDFHHVPRPILAFGINGRYANKHLPTGTLFPGGASSDFNVKVYNGQRLVYGADVAFQWLGFSIVSELHQLKITPKDSSASELKGLPQAKTKGYFLAGGWYVQASYNLKKINSIFSGRLEAFDANDLNNGNSRILSFAYAYRFKKSATMLKLQYWHYLKEERGFESNWKDQIRIGFNIVI
jgi:hypothetical protein